jgi:hypothetical protein
LEEVGLQIGSCKEHTEVEDIEAGREAFEEAVADAGNAAETVVEPELPVEVENDFVGAVLVLFGTGTVGVLEDAVEVLGVASLCEDRVSWWRCSKDVWQTF